MKPMDSLIPMLCPRTNRTPTPILKTTASQAKTFPGSAPGTSPMPVVSWAGACRPHSSDPSAQGSQTRGAGVARAWRGRGAGVPATASSSYRWGGGPRDVSRTLARPFLGLFSAISENGESWALAHVLGPGPCLGPPLLITEGRKQTKTKGKTKRKAGSQTCLAPWFLFFWSAVAAKCSKW